MAHTTNRKVFCARRAFHHRPDWLPAIAASGNNTLRRYRLPADKTSCHTACTRQYFGFSQTKHATNSDDYSMAIVASPVLKLPRLPLLLKPAALPMVPRAIGKSPRLDLSDDIRRQFFALPCRSIRIAVVWIEPHRRKCLASFLIMRRRANSLNRIGAQIILLRRTARLQIIEMPALPDLNHSRRFLIVREISRNRVDALPTYVIVSVPRISYLGLHRKFTAFQAPCDGRLTILTPRTSVIALAKYVAMRFHFDLPMFKPSVICIDCNPQCQRQNAKLFCAWPIDYVLPLV